MPTLMDSSVHSGVSAIPSLLPPGLTNTYSYDAHPMAILTSAFAYLGSYYSEANPSLQGAALPSSMSSWVERRARPEVIYQRRCGVFGNDRQANIQTDWQSHDSCCVSIHPTGMILSLTRFTSAWHTEFAKAGNLLLLLPISATLDRKPLAILRFRCGVDPTPPVSCT